MTIGLKANVSGTSGTIQIGGADQVTVDNAGGLTATTVTGTTVAGTTVTQGGVAMPRMVLGTSQATTSGTSVSFTGIPSWAKRITVLFSGVSVSAAAHLIVQIGSGSTTTSSYLSESSRIATGAVNAVQSTAGFVIQLGLGADTTTGHMVLTNISSNTWLSSHAIGNYAGATGMVGGGLAPNLAGALDRVVITTSNGTDTFDAGSVNILYEG